MKKLCFSLIFVIMTNLIPLAGVFAEEDFQGVSLSFDTYNPAKPQESGIDIPWGNLYSEECDGKGGVLSMSGGSRFYIDFEENAIEGIYHLSFEWKKTENAI